MDAKRCLELLKRVDFGEIDGYGDPNLDQYFLDNNYWDRILNTNVFYVAGRKGTGKSAIYRMIEEQSLSMGAIVHNTDFGEFPFQRLLQLSDNSFAKPSQYQSIWRYMILVDFCKLIAQNPVPEDDSNLHYQDIRHFIDNYIGSGILDIYRELLSHTKKTEISLAPDFLAGNVGREKTSSYNFSQCRDISELNQELSNRVINYLLSCHESRKIFIQFDRLDDNYNSLQDTQDYLCAITSLLKYVYAFNTELRRRKITNAKIIVYLRRDIFREISKIDAESARWDDYTYFIDWVIDNTQMYESSKLYALINKRIQVSLRDETIDFDDLFENVKIVLRSKKTVPVFKYIIDRTMHRPRDLIQFCKKIQIEAINNDALQIQTIKSAEKEYCAWLVYEELRNEINPIIDDIDELYVLLQEMGKKEYSLTDFYNRTKQFCDKQSRKISTEELARTLYDAGILQNINTMNSFTKMRNSFRNAGPLDKSMKVTPHLGVWRGISD